MSFRVRPLDADDAAAWQALRLQALQECPGAFASSHAEEVGTPLDEIACRLVPSGDALVLGAFAGVQLVGSCGLARERMHKLAHKAVLWGVYVHPAQRGRGIGRALTQAALEAAVQVLRVRRVLLGVNAANAPALALYEAMGFERIGLERGFLLVDGVEYDEWHMARVVEPAGPA